jgi:alkyl hydroperoxide reductase subunit AhpF
MLDLIIIGGAAVGSSAAIYAARRRLEFKMITLDLGGEVALSGEVANWPGIISTQGFELAQQFTKHVKSYNVDIEEGWKVVSITSQKNYHIVTAENAKSEQKTYETKTVIIGSGIHPRHLNVPGEEQFLHKGLTYCTVCDGPLFKNKVTATIGSGNSALESALMMQGIAQKVYVLSKFPNTKETNFGFPPGENILIEKLLKAPNVEIFYQTKTLEILGSTKVSGLRYEDAEGKEQLLEVDGVMVHEGMTPNSNFINHVEKNKAGEIIVDTKCKTNVPGIFAAGDVADIPYKQIGIAAGQGIVAALSAIEYLNRWQEQ